MAINSIFLNMLKNWLLKIKLDYFLMNRDMRTEEYLDI